MDERRLSETRFADDDDDAHMYSARRTSRALDEEQQLLLPASSASPNSAAATGSRRRRSRSQHRRSTRRSYATYSVASSADDLLAGLGSQAQQMAQTHAQRAKEQRESMRRTRSVRFAASSAGEAASEPSPASDPSDSSTPWDEQSTYQYLPRTDAATMLQHDLLPDELNGPVDTPLRVARDLRQRAELVKSSDFSIHDKRMLSRDEQARAALLERDLGCWERLCLNSNRRWKGLQASPPPSPPPPPRSKHSDWSESSLLLQLWLSTIKEVEGRFGTAIASFFAFTRWVFFLNFFISVLVIAFLVIPQVLHGTTHTSFAAENLALGNGYLETSVVFYGAYSTGDILENYDMSFAYFLVVAICLAISIIAIIHNMSKRYNDAIEIAGQPCPYSVQVFSGWDHAVVAPDTASRRRTGIARSLREMLAEDTIGAEPPATAGRYTARVIVNIVIFLTIGLAAYAIVVLAERYVDNKDTVKSLYPALAVTASNLILPTVFWYISIRFEQLRPRTLLRVHMARGFLLRVTGLYVITISVFGSRDRNSGQPNPCWETSVGQEIYRLLLVDTGVNMLSIFFYDAGRALLHKYGLWGVPQFSIGSSALTVMYRQGLVWVALFYSPLIASVACLLNALLVFVQVKSMFAFVHPPSRVYRWRLGSSSFYFMAILLLTLFVSIGPVAYAIAEKKPSVLCGPFAGMSSAYDLIPDKIGRLPSSGRHVLFFLGSPGFVVPLLVLLIITVYYFAKVARAKQNIIRHYELVMMREHEEKRSLVQAFTRAAAIL